ncbi:protein-glutamate O-methyltransferase [Methylocystis echinoides]|uniref:CheR family methyltransferase n=1 Tax=Methylocystis echinoides TaxID=29468 RepID=UPI00342C044E
MTAFKFTDGDFRQISRILNSEAGIYLSEAKAPFVYSRLTKRLRALGMESFHDYCALIASDSGETERYQMIAALTTNVTRFFREEHHFADLRRHVLERLAPAARTGRRIRVWSAACSSGQEPYSIAMTIFSVLPEAESLNIRVLATDIDSYMIEAAIAGEYGEDAVESVPGDMRRKWFSPAGEGLWKISERLGSIVAFRKLNLVRPWPMKGKFDAIFCRNVAIYFEEKTQQEIWRRFVPLLNPGGALYIGHSERVTGPAASVLVSDGVTTYRLPEGVGP